MADELINLDELQKVLQDYAKEAEEVYKYQISLGGKNASRKLTDSVKSKIVVNGQAFEIYLNLQQYWKYIEEGRKPGKFPPVGAILNWISVKPILPRPDGSGNMERLRPKQLAFLIGRKIKEEGIDPFPALKTTQEELNRIYHDRLSAALANDIGKYVRKTLTLPL